jgi:hypothetical protein
VKPHTWRVSMTTAVIASLLIGLAAMGFGIEDLRKINSTNASLNATNASVKAANASAAVPVTNIVAPNNGARVSGNVNLDAVSTGPIAASVEFVASGGTYNDVKIATGQLTKVGWVALWTTTGVPNGTYQIASVGFNAIGRSSRSASISVTVKNP